MSPEAVIAVFRRKANRNARSINFNKECRKAGDGDRHFGTDWGASSRIEPLLHSCLPYWNRDLQLEPNDAAERFDA